MFTTPALVDTPQDFIVHNRCTAPDLTGTSGWQVPLWDTWYYGNKNFEFESRFSTTANTTANVPVILVPGVYHINWMFRGAGTSASTMDMECYIDVMPYDGVQATTTATFRAANGNHRTTVTEPVRFAGSPVQVVCPLRAGYVLWCHIWRNVNSSALVMSGNYGLSLTRLGSE